MTNIEVEYEALIRELLEEIYSRKRETGKVSKAEDAYVKGFMDAGLNLDLITEEALNHLIHDMNMAMFGRSLEEQKKMFQKINRTYEDYKDVPAFFRKGKFFFMPNEDT